MEIPPQDLVAVPGWIGRSLPSGPGAGESVYLGRYTIRPSGLPISQDPLVAGRTSGIVPGRQQELAAWSGRMGADLIVVKAFAHMEPPCGLFQ